MVATTTAVTAARMREAARALVALALAASAAACTQGADGGTLGREGKVRFRAVTDLAFTTKLVVGSTFVFTSEPANDEVSLNGVTFSSSDEDVFTIEDASASGGTLRVKGAGSADVRVEKDGELLDAVQVSSGKPAATTLVDLALLGATDQVDARLPIAWGLLSGAPVALGVAAVDACGNELLDLSASSLEATGAQATITAAEANGFVIEPAEKGELELTLKTPGLDDLAYEVEVHVADDIDEARISIAAAEESQAIVWGRAFADDVEMVGALEYTWSADERVALASATGQAISLQISVPGPNEPPDDRPATLSLEVADETATVDLFALTEGDLVATRGEVARTAPEPEPQGCDGDGTCAALLAVFSLRRLRALRHA